MSSGINIRASQRAGDHKSVTVGRNGTGDFPNLIDAINYVGRFANDVTNFATIELGAGTFTINNSSGPIVLPQFIAIKGQAEALTNIQGTSNSNDLFQARNLFLSKCAVGGCKYAVNHVTDGTVYVREVEFNGFLSPTGVGLITSNVSLNFIQSCTAQGFTGPLLNVNGPTTAFAVTDLNCFIPANNATFLKVNDPGALVSIYSSVFDGVIATGLTGFDLDTGNIESIGNRFRSIATALTVASSASLIFNSKSDSMQSCTTDLVIEGASGSNASSYVFSNLSCDPDKMTLNGNRPPQNYSDDDGDTFSKSQYTTITGVTTISHLHDTVICNSASNFTVNLPPAAKFTGRAFTIKNINTGVVTIDGDASETIDGALTMIIPTKWATIVIASNGTEWFTLSDMNKITVSTTAPSSPVTGELWVDTN
jgi:hypothetical protein